MRTKRNGWRSLLWLALPEGASLELPPNSNPDVIVVIDGEIETDQRAIHKATDLFVKQASRKLVVKSVGTRAAELLLYRVAEKREIRMKRHCWRSLAASCLLVSTSLLAQNPRPLSADGIASVHVQGKWEKTERQQFTLGGERYVGGTWIDITYGRPLLRGRDAFTGTGADFGKAAYADAPVWRAGANLSTRLKTPIDLVIGGKTVPPGEYSLFIEFKSPNEWTFIVSNWAHAPRFNSPITEGLYGAFGYTPEKDVVRAPMRVDPLPHKVEQLTWQFVDMTGQGGTMAVMWDKTIASVPFTFAR